VSDLIKIFYDYGKMFSSSVEESFNQLSSKKINKILVIDIPDYDYSIYDTDVLKDRLFLYVISSNKGNLFPFLAINEKLFDRNEKGKFKKGGLTKAFNNMRAFLQKDDLDRFDNIVKLIDFEKIKQIVENCKIEESYYLAISYQSEFFNELFPDVIHNFFNEKKNFKGTDGICYIKNEKTKIGFDPQINFCSVNELPKKLGIAIKPRLLSLSADAGEIVKLGFEKIFNDFSFSLMGLRYILLPTVFGEEKLRHTVYELIKESKKSDRNRQPLKERVILEENLEFLLNELEGKNYQDSVLFTFLFYNKGKQEITLFQTIEDVAPSRIKKSAEQLEKYNIDLTSLSKYVKKTFKSSHPQLIYLRDYINDRYLIAKLIFGKEKITENNLYRFIFTKIFKGDNTNTSINRKLSLIISGYFKDDVDFEKHQRVCDFLSNGLNVMNNIILGGKKMDFSSFKEMVDWKFNNVDLLKGNYVRKEFYILGALAQEVISVQKATNADSNFKSSLETFLNSIWLVNEQNKDRVFNKIFLSAKKYNVYGKDWDFLIKMYVDIKSKIKEGEKVPVDIANILFVMGAIDFKNFKKGE